MSVTGRAILSCRFSSLTRRLWATLTATSTGIDVNKETTSKETSSSSSWRLMSAMLSHQEFVLFNNKYILLDGCSIFYKTWFDKGVYLIQDLLDADGKVMLYAEFTEKYLPSCNFLNYFQVIPAIPKTFIESAKVTGLPMKKMFFRFDQKSVSTNEQGQNPTQGEHKMGSRFTSTSYPFRVIFWGPGNHLQG